MRNILRALFDGGSWKANQMKKKELTRKVMTVTISMPYFRWVEE